MKKRIVGVLLVILILVGVKSLLFSTKTAKAAAPQEDIGVCVAQAPPEWGEFVGGSEVSGIAFKDRQGTLRFITNFPCNGTVPAIALEVRRNAAK